VSRVFEGLVMSALDQALRQIEQQRQLREKVPSQKGLI
jgi:hypothetical protein